MHEMNVSAIDFQSKVPTKAPTKCIAPVFIYKRFSTKFYSWVNAQKTAVLELMIRGEREANAD